VRIVRSKIPGLDGLPLVEYRKRFHQLKREQNRERFLTHDGKPRQRGFWHRHADLDQLPPAQRVRERQRRWAERRSAKAIELAWRAERATMGEIKAPEIISANYWARHEQ
jgi:hypothetical protein